MSLYRRIMAGLGAVQAPLQRCYVKVVLLGRQRMLIGDRVPLAVQCTRYFVLCLGVLSPSPWMGP